MSHKVTTVVFSENLGFFNNMFNLKCKKKMEKKLENALSDSMAQIEYVANKAQNDLNNDELFIEGEENGFAYEFDLPITKWISEEAVTDYFEDYLQDEFASIEKKYGVEPTIDFDYDGEIPQVVFGVDLTACI